MVFFRYTSYKAYTLIMMVTFFNIKTSKLTPGTHYTKKLIDRLIGKCKGWFII